MSKTLLDDNDHWIAVEGEGGDCKLPLSECVGFCPQHNPEPGKLPMLRVSDKHHAGTITLPLDKLRTALRRAHGPRRSWDDFFLDVAALWASRSKDPSTKVGCVIIVCFYGCYICELQLGCTPDEGVALAGGEPWLTADRGVGFRFTRRGLRPLPFASIFISTSSNYHGRTICDRIAL